MDSKLTEARQRAIINGYMTLLLLRNKPEIATEEHLQVIKAGWDAIKLPQMPSINIKAKEYRDSSPIILPFTETTKLPNLSQVQIDQLGADLYGRNRA